ncbi:Nn.00g098170.m01.CDS01 [Neocucurbitaria sp. VM-36]
MPDSPLDYLAVKNVLARYCEALDLKDFRLLEKVFLPDVIADYPFNSDLKGVDAVSLAIQNRLGPIRTHHNLTTQIITFDPNGQEARAVTYFTAIHFGQGPHEGKSLCAYGTYMDDLVLREANDGNYEGVQGASGIWRIKNRTVAFTRRIGDEMIMKEF